jgi:hypothetical protein
VSASEVISQATAAAQGFSSDVKSRRAALGGLPKNWSELSLGALCDALNHLSHFATPQSTINAVMFSLRGGTAVLSRDDVRRRLAVIDESRLREMIVLLQKRDGRIAPRWSDNDIEKLLETWTACRG